MTSGEVVKLAYTPATAFQVSGISQDFRGANNYRPNVTGDPYGDTGLGHQLPEPRHRHRCRPIPASRSATRRATASRGPWFWQMDLVAAKDFRLPVGADTRAQFRLEAFNLLNRANFRAPNGNRSAGAASARSRTTYDARQLQLGFKVTF